MGADEFERCNVIARLVDTSVLLGSLKSGGGVHLLVVPEISCERVRSGDERAVEHGPSQRVNTAMIPKETLNVHCAESLEYLSTVNVSFAPRLSTNHVDIRRVSTAVENEKQDDKKTLIEQLTPT